MRGRAFNKVCQHFKTVSPTQNPTASLEHRVQGNKDRRRHPDERQLHADFPFRLVDVRSRPTRSLGPGEGSRFRV